MIPPGAIDIHVHCAPDAIARAEHAWTVVQAAAAAGMRAIVLKDHCGSTAGTCSVLNQIQDRIHCIAAVTLNAPVGGLNPLAVEAALATGARMVFMPTYCARCHIERLGQRALPAGLPFPDLPYTGLSIFTPEGTLHPALQRICRSIAAHDAVLATGHLSPHEAFAVMALARDMGVRRMVVTHASERVPGFSVAEQQAAMALGAWIEHSFLPMTPCGGASLDAQTLHDHLRTVGLQRIILSSDFGQVRNGPVVAGFAQHLDMMRQVGFTDRDIAAMVVDHPFRLLLGDPT